MNSWHKFSCERACRMRRSTCSASARASAVSKSLPVSLSWIRRITATARSFSSNLGRPLSAPLVANTSIRSRSMTLWGTLSETADTSRPRDMRLNLRFNSNSVWRRPRRRCCGLKPATLASVGDGPSSSPSLLFDQSEPEPSPSSSASSPSAPPPPPVRSSRLCGPAEPAACPAARSWPSVPAPPPPPPPPPSPPPSSRSLSSASSSCSCSSMTLIPSSSSSSRPPPASPSLPCPLPGSQPRASYSSCGPVSLPLSSSPSSGAPTSSDSSVITRGDRATRSPPALLPSAAGASATVAPPSCTVRRGSGGEPSGRAADAACTAACRVTPPPTAAAGAAFRLLAPP
mmetsp:Transcript_30837/g.100556  ORF Transcript_30837/g.100556 Transcript_30837/m.100556 type:complete len:344 (+) Transcript_30837:222-1253(+)